MATTTMNISLPDSMKAFIDKRLSDDGYGTVSEYVRELVRSDQKRAEQDRLEKLLLERLESRNMKDLDIDDLRAELMRRKKKK